MALQPKFDAVIFDLDGVITKTALVHAAAWKRMFDDYLKSREERFAEPFREFTHAGDYLPYVDGKPRYKGVASFLESRGIQIPEGKPEDPPDAETVCGLGNRKNIMFNRVLDEKGVEVYESSVSLIRSLKEAGIRIGVASSSKNCKPVLERAGLMDLFETRVDGVVSAEIGLKGKPEPDIFITACDRLGVEYHRSVVVEDAVSGVQAGKKGNFGFVLGVAREENTRELLAGGADVVVADLAEMGLAEINRWFEEGMAGDGWRLRYHDYQPSSERSREALLAVGNGYFGTRGAPEESMAGKINYPGTYITGLYNRLVSRVADRDIENEDFVNAANWLPVTFRVEGGPWFHFQEGSPFHVISITRTLHFKNGLLSRELEVGDDKGRITRISSSRFAGMHDPHRAAIRYAITPVNWEGTIEIRSEVRGDHRNAGVERYNDLNQQHLEPVSEEVTDDRVKLQVRTTQSEILISTCARNRLILDGQQIVRQTGFTGRGRVGHVFELQGCRNCEIVLEKLVTMFTSRDPGVKDAAASAEKALGQMAGFGEELKSSEESWRKIWDRIEVEITGDREAQRLVRLHLFHMMVSASPHHAGLDSGIPPRGLHGEAYRGHIFWDELYMLPLYNIHFPEVTRSVLMYRYRRLDAARAYAREHGYQGAMFPWQSGSGGREETQVIHLNPLSGEWGDDYSSLQRHISLAIAYNLCRYYHTTGDREFMEDCGAEMLLDICKFWASKSERDERDGRYHIHRVMGPDEFHEKLPGAAEGGLSDNAYTNIMVCWIMDRAFALMDSLPEKKNRKILERLSLKKEDLDRWGQIRHNLALHISEEGVVEQFRGYFALKELDWDHYRNTYEDIHRLDRILKAEGKSPDDYKLAKQADFLMCFYNLGEEEVTRIIREMGYSPPVNYARINFDYYIKRTSHGSTLSRLVHARLANEIGLQETGWELFLDALRSDLVDIQGGTTGEGIHCGVMAGTVYDVVATFGGLSLRGDFPALNPSLPDHWKGLTFNFLFRGTDHHVVISKKKVKISVKSSGKEKIKVHLCGAEYEITQDEPVSHKLNAKNVFNAR